MELTLVDAGVIGSMGKLDLSSFLSLDRPAAFVFRVGTSLFASEGIFKGDFMVLRRDILPEGDPLVVVVKNNDFHLCRLSSVSGGQGIRLRGNVRLFGVVTAIFRRLGSGA